MATTGSAITRAPRPSSLADVLDLILDKGLVIDAYVRISAVGIEVLTIDARIVIASVDTYLHYAEAVNRLDLTQTETQGITGMFGGNSDRDSESSNGNGGGRESRSRSSNGSSRSRSSGRRLESGSAEPSDDEQDADDEDGRGRSLARRIGEKGRWNQ